MASAVFRDHGDMTQTATFSNQQFRTATGPDTKTRTRALVSALVVLAALGAAAFGLHERTSTSTPPSGSVRLELVAKVTADQFPAVVTQTPAPAPASGMIAMMGTN